MPGQEDREALAAIIDLKEVAKADLEASIAIVCKVNQGIVDDDWLTKIIAQWEMEATKTHMFIWLFCILCATTDK